jgi:hypothetical protein
MEDQSMDEVTEAIRTLRLKLDERKQRVWSPGMAFSAEIGEVETLIVEVERLRAYLNAIADGAHEGASHTWLKSMAGGALRGDPILVGDPGSWRQLGGSTGSGEVKS